MKKTTKSAQKDGAQKEEIVLNHSLEEFEMEVQTRLVTFRYRKKCGKLRTAVGTTNLALIPPAYWPKGKYVENTDDGATARQAGPCFSYWDTEEYDWRSFRLDLFDGFVVVIKKITECDFQN